MWMRYSFIWFSKIVIICKTRPHATSNDLSQGQNDTRLWFSESIVLQHLSTKEIGAQKCMKVQAEMGSLKNVTLLLDDVVTGP
nr:hypothetical protein CFP56_39597 [Quercus suber]